jgi:hypothetical protein
LDEDSPGWDAPLLRYITEAEERALTEELYQDEHADDTAHQRARQRWLNDS